MAQKNFNTLASRVARDPAAEALGAILFSGGLSNNDSQQTQDEIVAQRNREQQRELAQDRKDREEQRQQDEVNKHYGVWGEGFNK